jgi:hypothetical protein
VTAGPLVVLDDRQQWGHGLHCRIGPGLARRADDCGRLGNVGYAPTGGCVLGGAEQQAYGADPDLIPVAEQVGQFGLQPLTAQLGPVRRVHVFYEPAAALETDARMQSADGVVRQGHEVRGRRVWSDILPR